MAIVKVVDEPPPFDHIAGRRPVDFVVGTDETRRRFSERSDMDSLRVLTADLRVRTIGRPNNTVVNLPDRNFRPFFDRRRLVAVDRTGAGG